MRFLLLILCILCTSKIIIGPPVKEKKPEDGKSDENEVDGDHLDSLGIEYNRYLKEVVTALESDPDFRRKLEKAEEVDIRTGKIAKELEYVNHQVRTKLDELKRQELERLRHLAMKEYELRNGIDTDHLKIPPEHLDHSNPHTFEIEDLRKLITKTTADLALADKKRRQEFKEYEMQKEYEKHEKLKNLTEEQKQQLEKEMKQKEEKHKKHDPLHHPGSKQQLEEVWEKQDHMENQEFDPKTFFYLHDLDGNGAWDETEVKALFLKELDKLYNSGAPEDDMRERVEEMERMREHVFSEADKNKDGLISYEEFLAQTQNPDFEKDQGWESLDEQQVYTHEEYQEFERRRQAEVQRMIDQGLIPPYPHGMAPPPPHSMQQQQRHPAQQFQQQPGQYHPNQIPPGQFQGQYQTGHMPQGQHVPQGGYQQVPQGQYLHGQPQQVHYPTGQISQGQYGGNQPSQAQVRGSNIPQQQIHPGQVSGQQSRGQPLVQEVYSQQHLQQQQQPLQQQQQWQPQQQQQPLQQQQQPLQQQQQQPLQQQQPPQQQQQPPQQQQQPLQQQQQQPPQQQQMQNKIGNSNEIPQAASNLVKEETAQGHKQVPIPNMPIIHPRQPIESERDPIKIDTLHENHPSQQSQDHPPQ